MVIEQMINKDQKGPSRIIGFSTSPGTVQRWVLTCHAVARVSADFSHNIGLESRQVVPKDLGKRRRLFNEVCIVNCFEIIKSWNNPLEQNAILISLSCGIEAPADVQNDLLKAVAIGYAQVKTFIACHIESGTNAKIPETPSKGERYTCCNKIG